MNDSLCRGLLNKTSGAAFVIAFFATMFGTSLGNAKEYQTAVFMQGGIFRHEANLPNILSGADAERYRLISLLQGTAQWSQADREIAQLKDKLLLGHALAQRYLHPRYRSAYHELANWLDHYADEPEAKRIYALALKRAPAGAAPAKPVGGALIPQTSVEADFGPRPVRQETGADSSPARWRAGLAAWQENHLEQALADFAVVAKAPGQSPWTAAAAAFWVARVELKSRHPEHVAYWLGIAAEKDHTFYGLIARRLLGVDAFFNFDSEPFTERDAQAIEKIVGGRRALACIQIGDDADAEAELRLLATRNSTQMLRSIAALSDRANMPALSLQLASILSSRDGRDHDHALYPVPRWRPYGGFTVDRALLYAVMRQESLFVPHVVSNAGARGLMQLMPATARSMATLTGMTAEDRRVQREQLVNPEINLTLAQEYVETLLNDDHIRDNLLYFALAYNGGPGMLQRVKAAAPDRRDDPLLFLETFPVGQSRIYTERVLTNYWIYRMRLGQPTPGLDALAAGRWPTYTALESHEPANRHVADNQ
jgi:peptidoglycan lytic transglycosylase